MNMSLEQVRDALKGVWVPTHWGTDGRSYKMSDLIESLDHYLSQPQPVAQGEAVAWAVFKDTKGSIDGDPSCYRSSLDEDGLLPGFSVRPLYATPTIPTGHRVVPVEPDILRDLRKFQEETEACDEFDLTNESIAALLIANLIEGTHYMLTKKGEAMLSAAPDAGGA